MIIVSLLGCFACLLPARQIWMRFELLQKALADDPAALVRATRFNRFGRCRPLRLISLLLDSDLGKSEWKQPHKQRVTFFFFFFPETFEQVSSQRRIVLLCCCCCCCCRRRRRQK